MSFFDTILINTIFIIFPINLYLIFVAYNTNKNNRTSEISLDITCLAITYLIIKYSVYSSSISTIFLINLPLIILFLKKRKRFPIIISILIILFCYYKYQLPCTYLIIEYLCYLILFEVLKKEKFKTLDFFVFLKGIVLSMELIYLIPHKDNLLSILVEIFLNLVIFYFITVVILKMLATGEDIVSYNKMVKQLEKEKLLKNSLFKITHEVKNPIAVCKGYLSMMDYSNVDKVKKYNEVIKSELDRTLDIMDNFSQYTKINVKKDIMDINLLIEDAIESIKFISNEKLVEINYYGKEEIYIDGDYDRLKQVIINLVKNSIEAINVNGRVDITLKNNPGNVKIIIADNGEGMTKDDLIKITELFYSSKKNGCGIGVCLSMEIIKLHGGNIVYKSKKGKGTEVIIKIPVN